MSSAEEVAFNSIGCVELGCRAIGRRIRRFVMKLRAGVFVASAILDTLGFLQRYIRSRGDGTINVSRILSGWRGPSSSTRMEVGSASPILQNSRALIRGRSS